MNVHLVRMLVNEHLEKFLNAWLLCGIGIQFLDITGQKLHFSFQIQTFLFQRTEHLAVIGLRIGCVLIEIGTRIVSHAA